MDLRSNQDILLDEVSKNTKDSLVPRTVYITGNKKFTGPFFAYTALEDSTFDASECVLNIQESDGSGAMREITTNLVIPIGFTIYGNFLSIELDSGSGMAYTKNEVVATVEA